MRDHVLLLISYLISHFSYHHMEYLDKLKQMTAWDAEPELTEEELEGFLAAAALEDVNGLAPLHEEWTPTYDLNAAATAAWLIKAARAAALVDRADGGHCDLKDI